MVLGWRDIEEIFMVAEDGLFVLFHECADCGPLLVDGFADDMACFGLVEDVVAPVDVLDEAGVLVFGVDGESDVSVGRVLDFVGFDFFAHIFVHIFVLLMNLIFMVCYMV